MMTELIERYEFKYRVTERQVPAIRDALRTTSQLDKYAGPDGTYLIRSLYLDTEGLDLYRANAREQRDRFKARIRNYPGKNSPIFFEIKRRVGDVIVKSRAAVPEAIWRDVLEGRDAALATLSPAVRGHVDAFLARYHRHHLVPMLLVEYEREPYFSVYDGYARVTFDRKIRVQRKETLDLEANPRLWRAVDDVERSGGNEPIAVLELKFERRPPAWMSALVRRLELERTSFSKYCYGMAGQLAVPELRTSRWGDGFGRTIDVTPREELRLSSVASEGASR